MTIRALIADDEPVARERVKMFLAAHSDIEVVGEYGSGAETRDAIRALHPDLVFLDIEMPELSGMELAQSLEGAQQPIVLFLTAHADYALAAFDASAADYLLKPFSQERFDRALARVRPLVEARRTRIDRIVFKKSRGRIGVVKIAAIRWIGAEGNYARLYTAEGSVLVRESIQGLEAALDPAKFVRVHRSTIVNVAHLVELQCDAEGSHSVVTDRNETLSVGPKYRDRVRAALAR